MKIKLQEENVSVLSDRRGLDVKRLNKRVYINNRNDESVYCLKLNKLKNLE